MCISDKQGKIGDPGAGQAAPPQTLPRPDSIRRSRAASRAAAPPYRITHCVVFVSAGAALTMTDCLLSAGLFPHRLVLRVLGRPGLRNTADNRLGGRGQPQEGGVGEQRGGRGLGRGGNMGWNVKTVLTLVFEYRWIYFITGK